MHLAAPLVGHDAPVAAVPPLAHVHRLVAHWRLREALGVTVSYSAMVHALHGMHAPYPVLSEYVPDGHTTHCEACCSLLVSEPKFDPKPGPHVT